ncbi:MAG: ABC transporter permease [Acidimicrobiales bacterium]|nr:ABC transporter permease [Acidimicrobiales bacterium]
MTVVPSEGAAGSTTGEATFLRKRYESPSRRFARRLLSQKVATASGVILILVVLSAIFAPLLAPLDPNKTDLRNTLLPPGSADFLLGTDYLGRDVLSRLLFAGRVSLVAAVQAVSVGLILGVAPALVAGYVGRWWDWLLMRFTDALLAFPPLILAITVIGILGTGLTNAMIGVGIIFAPRFARITRSAVLSVREETFVEAAKSMGLSQPRIIWRHVLPHLLSPLVVTATVLAGMAMIIEAGLSFIGLGVQVPQASWGSMLSTAYRFIRVSPTLILWPGLAIMITVLSVNLLGDGIRDALGREVRDMSS